MALTEPVVITINGVPFSLPRINTGNNSSEYSSGDGNTRLTASHQYGRRTRRVFRLDTRKIAPDPISAVNTEVSTSCYVVFDLPRTGFTVVESVKQFEGLSGLMNANASAITTKLLGGES